MLGKETQLSVGIQHPRFIYENKSIGSVGSQSHFSLRSMTAQRNGEMRKRRFWIHPILSKERYYHLVREFELDRTLHLENESTDAKNFLLLGADPSSSA